MHTLDQRPYFFDAGLRFTCRRCGTCCTGEPGIVRTGSIEIERIAGYLKMTPAAVATRYLTPSQGGYRVRELDDGRCIFFEAGCRIYPVRPLQCRTYPFWISTLRSPDRWQATCRQCPGIGSGRLYSREEILTMLVRGDAWPPATPGQAP
jgi:hypothetical protein